MLGEGGHTPLTPAACRATLPGLFRCYLFCLLGGKSYVCKPLLELPQQEKSRGGGGGLEMMPKGRRLRSVSGSSVQVPHHGSLRLEEGRWEPDTASR